MALSNEDKQEIRNMIKADRLDRTEEITKIVRKTVPEMFGRSIEQLRSYFTSQIT